MEVKEEKKKFGLEILATIKTSQLQNGLRHGDYSRYRQYCSKRLHRIRTAVKFLNKRDFKKKVLEAKHVTNAKYLSIPLMASERAWSYAMALRNENSPSPRVKHHLVARLKKAAKHSTELKNLCHACGDEKTSLEADAYSAYMHGTLYLEQLQFTEALKQFLHAKTVYEELGKLSDPTSRSLYQERVMHLDNSIKYSEYMAKQSGEKTTDQQSLLEEFKGSMDDILKSRLEQVTAAMLKQQAKSLDSIQWQNVSIPIKSEKLRLCIVAAKDLAKQISNVETKEKENENKMEDVKEEKKEKGKDKKEKDKENKDKEKEKEEKDEKEEKEDKTILFSNLLNAYDDASTQIRDELKALGSHHPDEPHLLALKNYVLYHKLSAIARRNLFMATSLANRLRSQEKQESRGGLSRKKAKPDDLVVLYEKLLQNMNEMAELVTSDKNLQSEVAAKIQSFKAFRCFYLAESYRASSKWTEAYALYDRSQQLITSSISLHGNITNPDQNLINELKQLSTDATANQSIVHARGCLDSIKQKSVLTQQLQDMKLDEQGNQSKAASKTLLERIIDYEPGEATNNYRLVEFPPSFQPVPCRPQMFDLASTALTFPSLVGRFKKQQKSFFSKFKLWGN